MMKSGCGQAPQPGLPCRVIAQWKGRFTCGPAPVRISYNSGGIDGLLEATAGIAPTLRPCHHYSSYYLYAEHGIGRNITLIDVTKTSRPSVLAYVSYASAPALAPQKVRTR
jgi:hypothetical protein